MNTILTIVITGAVIADPSNANRIVSIGSYETMTYFASKDTMTLGNATQFCQSNNALLAILDSAAVFTFVTAALISTLEFGPDQNAKFYVNAEKQSNDTFKWANGIDINPSFWASEEPKVSEDSIYVQLKLSNNSYSLQTARSQFLKFALCQRDTSIKKQRVSSTSYSATLDTTSSSTSQQQVSFASYSEKHDTTASSALQQQVSFASYSEKHDTTASSALQQQVSFASYSEKHDTTASSALQQQVSFASYSEKHDTTASSISQQQASFASYSEKQDTTASWASQFSVLTSLTFTIFSSIQAEEIYSTPETNTALHTAGNDMNVTNSTAGNDVNVTNSTAGNDLNVTNSTAGNDLNVTNSTAGNDVNVTNSVLSVLLFPFPHQLSTAFSGVDYSILSVPSSAIELTGTSSSMMTSTNYDKIDSYLWATTSIRKDDMNTSITVTASVTGDTETLNPPVTLADNSSVSSTGNSSIGSTGNSPVTPNGNSSVNSKDNSAIISTGNSLVTSTRNSPVTSTGNLPVISTNNSSVSSFIILRNSSSYDIARSDDTSFSAILMATTNCQTCEFTIPSEVISDLLYPTPFIDTPLLSFSTAITAIRFEPFMNSPLVPNYLAGNSEPFMNSPLEPYNLAGNSEPFVNSPLVPNYLAGNSEPFMNSPLEPYNLADNSEPFINSPLVPNYLAGNSEPFMNSPLKPYNLAGNSEPFINSPLVPYNLAGNSEPFINSPLVPNYLAGNSEPFINSPLVPYNLAGNSEPFINSPLVPESLQITQLTVESMSATVIILLPILPSYNTHQRLSSIAKSLQSDLLLRNIDEDLDHVLMVTAQSQELQTKSYIAGSVEYVDLGLETKHLTDPLELIHLNRETINMIGSVQYISLNQKPMDTTGSLDYVSMTTSNFTHNLSVPVSHSVTSEGPTLQTGDDITADIITQIRGTRVFDTTHNSISIKQLPSSSTEEPHTISSLSWFQSSTVRYRLSSCPCHFRSADSKRVNKRSSEYGVKSQLPEKTSRVELNLVLEKSGLSQYKRKRNCAYDPRFSCQVTAVASLTFLLLIVTILVVSDMPALYRQSPLWVLCQTTGDNWNQSYQGLSKGV